MLQVIKNRKIWFTVSSLTVIFSIIIFFIWGLKLGIDFTGGSLLEITYFEERPQASAVVSAITESQILENVNVQPTGENGQILRFENVTEEKHQEILFSISENFGEIQEERFDSIGPVIGKELQVKTFWAIIIVLFAIIAYISYTFRKISKPVPSYLYGIIAIIALFHDIAIVIGMFVLLGHFYNVEVNASFVAALLTILGYSVNDTIVIFDRTRENLAKNYHGDFQDVIERSISESLVRSINSSFTTLLVLLSVFLFGGETIRSFMLALIVGIVVGTYSSIFLASPLLLEVKNRIKKI